MFDGSMDDIGWMLKHFCDVPDSQKRAAFSAVAQSYQTFAREQEITELQILIHALGVPDENDNERQAV